MKENSLSSSMSNYWERRLANRLYGFNTDPRTNRIDEYERYNRIRRELYAIQDAVFRRNEHTLGVFLVALLALSLFV